jgi:[ribosomal protein S18]-alanine N-acetyltransferase
VTRTIEIDFLTPELARALAAPLAQLHASCFAEDPWDPGAISEIAGLAGFLGLVARAGDDPIGFVLAFGPDGECEIAALGVAPWHRRRGVGSALIAALGDELRRRGGRSILLEVAADNAAARALYAQCGFVRAGWRREYYRRPGRPAADAAVLRLALAPLPSI